MERFFQYRDRWGNGLTLWVVVIIAFTTPLLLIALKDVSLENDVTTWLPNDDPDARSLNWFSNQFEKENRLILSWESSSLNDPRVAAFATALQRDGLERIAGIESVTTAQDVIQSMLENKVSAEDAVDRVTGVLVGVGFLKVKLTAAGKAQSSNAQELIRSIGARVVGDSVTILPPVPEYEQLAVVLSAEEGVETSAGDVDREATTEAVSMTIPEHDFQLRWSGMTAGSEISLDLIQQLSRLELSGEKIVEGAFFAPGAPVATVISFHDESDRDLAVTLTAIEAVAAEQGIPTDELRLAGSPVSRVRLNAEAKRAVWNTDYPVWNLYKRTPILLSALVGVLASFFLLRSFRLAALVTLASTYTCLVILALIPLTGKSLNMVLIVLPDLLLVLTTSGAIHVANYWKHAVTKGEPHPIANAVQMAWQPCLLASVTTAIGMASLLTAILQPVQEFGFYSSMGCLVSLGMILIGFPSLMSAWPGRGKCFKEHAEREATVWGHLGRKIVHHQLAISLTCLFLFLFAIAGLPGFKTETKVVRYFPLESRLSRDYHFLEEALAGVVSVDTVLRFDDAAVERLSINERLQIVRDVEAKIAAHPGISGTLSLADFRDPLEAPSENASTREKIRFGRTLQRIEQGIFDEEKQVASAAQFARKASADLHLKTQRGRQLRINEGEEIWRIRAQSVLTSDLNYSNLSSELEEITSLATQDQEGVEYLVTGMVPLFLRTQQAVLESLIKSFGLAFVVIALVMMVLLRSPTSGLLAMLPNLFPVGLVFGLVAWLGIPVDIGTMITASVALGIAVDGTLHLLTWYRDGIRHGLNREEAVVLGLQHCGPAMWQTSATISLSIIMVTGADLLLISRFGLLLAALVATALIADVVLLPALLGGWLGRIIERNTPVAVSDASEPSTIRLPSEVAEKEYEPAFFPAQVGKSST